MKKPRIHVKTFSDSLYICDTFSIHVTYMLGALILAFAGKERKVIMPHVPKLQIDLKNRIDKLVQRNGRIIDESSCMLRRIGTVEHSCIPKSLGIRRKKKMSQKKMSRRDRRINLEWNG